ncbi:hypothetical protein DH86_00000629, partial [Scytalidium sp. 3C]
VDPLNSFCGQISCAGSVPERSCCFPFPLSALISERQAGSVNEFIIIGFFFILLDGRKCWEPAVWDSDSLISFLLVSDLQQHLKLRIEGPELGFWETARKDGSGVQCNFRGQHGKAYLFNNVVNITAGEPSERNMTTGRHIVRDIACRQCKETVGWKYDKAFEASEKYKEGKFILEAELLCNVT